MQPGRDYIGVGVGVMVFNKDGELLLLKRGKATGNERGRWELPGGRVEFGETLAKAAVREVKEEIGLDVVVGEPLFTVDHLIPDEEQHWVSTMFVVRLQPGQKPKIIEPDKCEDLGWFDMDKLPSPLSIVSRIKIDLYNRRVR